MKPLIFTLTLFLAQAADKPAIDATTAWSKLKSLVGDWQADTPAGKETLTYELIAGGTALLEHERADNHPEMLTVYHLDGKRLMLTHYCMAGNQPRMEARSFNPGDGDIQFQFVDATNMPNPQATHMHSVSMRLIDDRHLSSDWRLFENGKLKMTETAQYTRVR
jgi:hypothetical protein